MPASRWAKVVFPWVTLGGEVSARWLWAFRVAWAIGLLGWGSATDHHLRGLLSFLLLFFMVGNSLNPERAIRSRVIETAAIFVFSLLFINGIAAFVPAKALLGLLAGQVMTFTAWVYGVGFHVAAMVFAAMWLMLLRHWRAASAHP